MRRALLRLAFLAFVALFPAAVHAQPGRNLFHELLGKSEEETSEKIQAAWQQYFESNQENERLYFPVGSDMAYIADIGNGDVRSEGMSYGLMLAVQMDRQQVFNRLWKWARTYMYHADGPRKGYFAWQCKFDGTVIGRGVSASDGEEWIVTALFFAAHRWGDGTGIFAYTREAQALLREMLHKPATPDLEITSIFDREHKQVVFVPIGRASKVTDPSYHLPHFYSLWARWAEDPADRAFWAEAARESRQFFRRAANPKTGLMPECANFDGTPVTRKEWGVKDDFSYDAWRTLANVALDYTWGSGDEWEVEQSNRVLRFFNSFTREELRDHYTLAGRALGNDCSSGFLAMASVAGLAADPKLATTLVRRFWENPFPTGQWRYYNGLLTLLGLLEAGGRFQSFDKPADGAPAPVTTSPTPPPVSSAALPSPRRDANSMRAHEQLVAKAKAGGIDLYMLGDSITRRWGCTDPQWAANMENWKKNFFGWNAGNFGWGADGIQNILWRIQNGELDGVNPKVIVIEAGTNNVGNKLGDETKTADIIKGIKALLDTCREKAPDAKIIVMGIFPRNDNLQVVPEINQINAGIAQLADDKTIHYLNINDQLAAPDGKLFDGMTIDNLHLTVKGYQIWAEALKPLLTELLGAPASTDHAPPPTGDPSAAKPALGS